MVSQYNIRQWRDISMLRLFEVFIESAPQMVLQLYILAYNRHFDKDNDWLTALSACFSLISLASSIVCYYKALRDASENKGKMTWWAFACQIAWRITMVASRIVTLVLFASVHKSWILLFICLHWFLMTFWIRWQKPSFDSNNKILKFMFPIVVGFIYVFCFFNVKDGLTRKRLIFFYALMFVENCVLMGFWLPYRHEYGVVFVAALGVVLGGFFIGVIAMVLYYHCYHPSLSTHGIFFKMFRMVKWN
ncbi:XK-related protein 7-like [Dendronephthya gigantea]|uniref:XK-related protein 7-like n=1 Tax=Dendronephthya gigantea TaxID=151771 RepID=UPI00106C6C37|nr:XK-related protein 7-like [Dendronephthya gigantea]